MSEIGRRDKMFMSPIPPPYRTILDDRPTLLVTYWCMGCSIAMILFRCAGRLIRLGRLYRDDKLMLLTIVPMLIRVAFVHVVLMFGTNNVDISRLGEEELWKRRIGSGMVLAARVFYPAYIWAQKFCITEFYVRLTSHLYERSYRIGLKAIRWGLLATFLAVVVTVFAECRPTEKYWQVKPDPGVQCRQAYVPLFTMGTLSIATDILLVFCTMPAIIRSTLKTSKKIRLLVTFSLSIFCIALTSYRIYSVIDRRGAQPYRTLMASFDMLLSTFVSNAIIINMFARDRGEKRNKFHFVRDMTESPVVIRRNHGFGSEEELAGGDLYASGILPSSHRSSNSSYDFGPSPLPASPTRSPSRYNRSRDCGLTVPKCAMTLSPPGAGVSELLKRANSDITLVAGGYRDSATIIHSNKPSPKLRDVGGLLEEAKKKRRSGYLDSDYHHRRSQSAPAIDIVEEHGRRKSESLMDVGGLLALKTEVLNGNQHRRSRSLPPSEESGDGDNDGDRPSGELKSFGEMLRADAGQGQTNHDSSRNQEPLAEMELSDVGGLLSTDTHCDQEGLEMSTLPPKRSQ